MVRKTKQYQAVVRDMLGLEVPSDVRVSPNGNKVAFTVRATHWKDNCYVRHCSLFEEPPGATSRLTRYGDVQQMQWVDDDTLALLKPNGGKTQVWIFENGKGEGWQVTNHKTGVEWFQSFAGGIVFRALQPEKFEKKKRTGQYGHYTRFEQEVSASALYSPDRPPGPRGVERGTARAACRPAL